MLTKSIESAQKKIEGHHFAIRKNVLQYDDVLSRQREIIYAQRDQVLDGENLKEQITNMITEVAEKVVSRYVNPILPESEWNIEGLKSYYLGWILTPEDLNYDSENNLNMSYQEILDLIKSKSLESYQNHEETFGEEMVRELERHVLLTVVDEQWMDHIDAMEELKQGISLRSYGQKDPVVEYRVEGFDMFNIMVDTIRENTVKNLLGFKINSESLFGRAF